MDIIHNKGFLKSSRVKLFPCAYRGTNTASETLSLYDPEARLNTEYNFTREGSGISDLVASYIISWTPNALVCIIAGYTFELKVSKQDFVNDVRFKNKDVYIKIKLKQHDITSEYKTKVLGTQLRGTASTDGDLDSVVDTVDNNQYFTGLVFVTTAADTPEDLGSLQNNEYTLRIIKANGEVDSLNLLPRIAKGSGVGSIILGKTTKNPNNQDGVVTLSNLTELTEQASGDYAVAMNSGSANGENAVAANTSAVSNEKAAGFNNSVVSGFMAFGANEGHATASSSAAFGITTANKENQLTAGKYNDTFVDTLLSIGNGTSDSDRHNAFTVNKAGEASVASNLEVGGDASVAGTLAVTGNSTFKNITTEQINCTKVVATGDGSFSNISTGKVTCDEITSSGAGKFDSINTNQINCTKVIATSSGKFESISTGTINTTGKITTTGITSSGEITAPTFNGAASKLSCGTVGSTTGPVYFDAGVPKAVKSTSDFIIRYNHYYTTHDSTTYSGWYNAVTGLYYINLDGFLFNDHESQSTAPSNNITLATIDADIFPSDFLDDYYITPMYISIGWWNGKGSKVGTKNGPCYCYLERSGSDIKVICKTDLDLNKLEVGEYIRVSVSFTICAK